VRKKIKLTIELSPKEIEVAKVEISERISQLDVGAGEGKELIALYQALKQAHKGEKAK